MSFEDAEVEFSNYKGYTTIKGINENVEDNAASNGSGKSTLFEAIIWNLTGNTLRGNKDVVRIGENDCFVELTFTYNDDEYIIKRSKGSNTNINILINGEDRSGKGIRDGEKLLQQYLPDVTASLINTVIILGQGLPERFTDNSPSGRKEILEKLSKSDFMIEDLKERIANRATALSQRLRELQDTKLAYESEINVYNSTILTAQTELDSIGTIVDIQMMLNTHSESLQQSQLELSELQEQQSTLQNKVNELSEKINTLNTNYINNKELTESQIKDKYHYNDLVNEKIRLLGLAQALDSEIKKLKNVVDTCPTCGQKLPNVHKIDTSDKELELKELNNKVQDVINNINLYNEDLTTSISTLKQELDKQVYTLNQELVQNKSIMAGNNQKAFNLNTKMQNDKMIIDNCNTRITTYETKKETLIKTIAENTGLIEENNKEILYINSKIEDIEKHNNVINKFSTAIKRDFRGYLLINIIDYINRKAKEYSRFIFETDKVEFILDGNNIDIRYADKEYEALSGGEKQKLDLIVQFAIRDMLCKYLGFSTNILVLDEITDNLDNKGCDKIIDFISNKLEDIEDIFIISHRIDTLNIPYDNELTVIKQENGVSKIK